MFTTLYQKLKLFIGNGLLWLWENKIKILKSLGYFLIVVIIRFTRGLIYGIRKLLSYVFRNKRKSLKILGYSAFTGFVIVAFLFIYFSKDLPPRDTINDLFVPESTKILDRTGTSVLYDIYDEYNRTVVSRDEIPDFVRWATIVAEDDDFYHHWGIDFKAILRAFITNLRGGQVQQGGSTITQQYIKNLLLSPERTYARKIKEAVLSIEMEFLYTKDEILTGYLNYVPYGSNAYGIEAAAKVYFDKSASELTLSESALLAAIPQATTYYSNHPDALRARQEYILDRMLNFGYISQEQHTIALEEKFEFEQKYTSIKSPHFVILVKQYLEEKFGTSFVQQAGLRVITTLDRTLQDAAESAVAERADFNKTNFNAHNAAMLAIDPHTGQILAMVGSKNYLGESSPAGCISGRTCLFDPQVNIVTTLQQPGSSFKPFAYAVAFEKGLTPDTIVYDIKTEFNPDCHWSGNEEKDQYGLDCYNPDNYDLLEFGAISLKEALAQSRNIGSVKVLYLAGVENTIELARRMGIESLGDRSGYGLSLVLGGADVTLLEEVSAFGTFATRGIRSDTSFILKIEDKGGNVLEEFEHKSQKVLDENIANQINYILSTNRFRSRVFGAQNNLTIGGLDIAAKTGSTQDFRDALTIGYTPNLVAGVWVGNNNNEPMREAPGASAAAPIWNSFFRKAYENKYKESDELKEKDFYFNLSRISEEDTFVDPIIEKTGKDILDGILGVSHNILHFISRADPLSSGNSRNDPQYTNWEDAVQNWTGGVVSHVNNSNSGNDIDIKFIRPNKTLFNKNSELSIVIDVSSDTPIASSRITLDNVEVYSQKYSNNLQSIQIFKNVNLLSLEENTQHTILVEIIDKDNAVKQKTFIFRVE